MSRFFTAHARDRFEERYGYRPTIKQLSYISKACLAGSAMVMRRGSNASTTFCCRLNDTLTYPVIIDRIIVTFQPCNFFIAKEAKKHRQEAGKLIGRQPKPREPKNYIRGEPYRRDRSPVSRLLEDQ